MYREVIKRLRAAYNEKSAAEREKIEYFRRVEVESGEYFQSFIVRKAG